MTALVVMSALCVVMNVAILWLLRYHHHQTGPDSAAGKILTELTDLRARLDVLERLSPLFADKFGPPGEAA